MTIHNFGLFWQRDEIEWTPGKGVPDRFMLLGRVGINLPKRRVADFRYQQGIYILYNSYTSVYVGLAGHNRLGARLREHTCDPLKAKWSRFSWFGFSPVEEGTDQKILKLVQPKDDISFDTQSTIRDTEALLQRVLNASENTQKTAFQHGCEWDQVLWHEIKNYTGINVGA